MKIIIDDKPFIYSGLEDIIKELIQKDKEIEKINKATNYYLKELSKRGSIDDVAVKM